MERLPGDVSTRLYYRVSAREGARTSILAHYDDASRQACQRWLASTRLLEEAGIRVPTVLEADCRRGWMLLEDLGRTTLFDLETTGWAALEPYLLTAVALLGRLTTLPTTAVRALNPPLDADLLRRELRQTWQVYLTPRGLCGSPPEARRLEAALDELCRRLGALPPLPCHRDFMARNLVPCAGGSLAVLDHQDLRLGPPQYDLASLLNDSLYPPSDLEDRLLAAAGLETAGLESYRRAAAQRTLKIVGTFEAFAERGDDRYRRLIPPSMGAALRHLQCLEETAEAVRPLADAWRSVC